MNRSVAQVFSFLGHPMLVLTYMLLLMLAVNPFVFGVNSIRDEKAMVLLISVFSTTVVIPGIGVALMKPLGLVSSLQLSDQQERIGPYILTGVFYLWLFKNLFSMGQIPELYSGFVLGGSIGLFLAFFINIFTKISAHAVGMGGFVVMVLLLSLNWGGQVFGLPVPGGTLLLGLNAVLFFTVLLAGLVGSARLALHAHTPPDLYRGYLAGAAAAVAGYLIMG